MPLDVLGLDLEDDDSTKEVSMVKFKHRGSFNRTERFLLKMFRRDYLNVLDQYGRLGVQALAAATPKDTGETASSWTYEITHTSTTTKISWLNTNVNDRVVIAILLQYGHGTGTGGYVQGTDYINPAMLPIFDKLAENVWKEVTSA